MKRALLIFVVACGGTTKSAPKQQRPGDVGTELTPPDGEKVDVRSAPPPPPDQLNDDQPEVVGAIPKDSIHRVVKENFTSIRQCYEQLVMANPGLQGKVIAKFSVGLDGTVQVASASGVHPDLETCVATQIRKFKFPRPDGVKGDVLVTYPFTFKP